MTESDVARPRYVPDVQWPSYAYVPNRGLPHPIADADGHSFGERPAVEHMDPVRWQGCRAFLRGVDLFNHGFYWEAHEAWEGVWRAFDRSETIAQFLQGLIKLAAAGVKTREGIAAGVVSLASGAAGHFDEVRARIAGRDIYCGLRVDRLIAAARSVQNTARRLTPDSDRGPKVVFDFVLEPRGDEH